MRIKNRRNPSGKILVKKPVSFQERLLLMAIQECKFELLGTHKQLDYYGAAVWFKAAVRIPSGIGLIHFVSRREFSKASPKNYVARQRRNIIASKLGHPVIEIPDTSSKDEIKVRLTWWEMEGFPTVILSKEDTLSHRTAIWR